MSHGIIIDLINKIREGLDSSFIPYDDIRKWLDELEHEVGKIDCKEELKLIKQIVEELEMRLENLEK